MLGRHRAVPEADRPDGDPCGIDGVQKQPHAEDVDQRIDRTDLVEVHLVERHAVGNRLDLTERPEGSTSPHLDSGREIADFDQLVDIGPATVSGRRAAINHDLDTGARESTTADRALVEPIPGEVELVEGVERGGRAMEFDKSTEKHVARRTKRRIDPEMAAHGSASMTRRIRCAAHAAP